MSKKIIYILLLLFLWSLYSHSFAISFFNKQAYVKYNGDSICIDVWVYGSDTVSMERKLPIFKFTDNKTGEFIKQLNDSMAQYDGCAWRVIQPIETFNFNYARLSSRYMTVDIANNITGVILSEAKKNKVLGVVHSDTNWLKNFGIVATGDSTTIIIKHSYSIFNSEFDTFKCVLKVNKSGKVDIPFFTEFDYDIVDYKGPNNFISKFLWIKEFYRKNDFDENLIFLNKQNQ